MDCTIFEQDGTIYTVIVMDPEHAKHSARDIAKGVRDMAKIPRARMRVIPVEEVRTMPFGSPKEE